MFYTGQFTNKSSTGGYDQTIVTHISRAGFNGTPAILQTCRFGLVIGHFHAPEEIVQRHDQILGLTQARRNPYGAREIDEFRLGCNYIDLQTVIGGAQLANCGESAESGANHGNA